MSALPPPAGFFRWYDHFKQPSGLLAGMLQFDRVEVWRDGWHESRVVDPMKWERDHWEDAHYDHEHWWWRPAGRYLVCKGCDMIEYMCKCE